MYFAICFWKKDHRCRRPSNVTHCPEKNMNVQRYSHLTEFKGYPIFRNPHQKIMQRHLPHIWPWMLQFGSPTPSWRWKPFKNQRDVEGRCLKQMFRFPQLLTTKTNFPQLFEFRFGLTKKLGEMDLSAVCPPGVYWFGNTHENDF